MEEAWGLRSSEAFYNGGSSVCVWGAVLELELNTQGLVLAGQAVYHLSHAPGDGIFDPKFKSHMCGVW
jgi:hypothetical protein